MSNNNQATSGSSAFMIPPVLPNAPNSNAPADDSHASAPSGHEPSSENVSMLQSALGTYISAEDSLMKTTNVHEHMYPKLFFRGSAICLLVMLILFIVWMLTTPTGYPWFIHVFHVFGMVIAVLYAVGHTSNDLHQKIFSIHTSFLVLTIGMFTIANLYARGFPWAIFPCTFFCIVYAIHALFYKFYSALNPLSIHLIFFIACNILFFVWYCYGGVSFPWNLPILAVWTVAIIVHAILHIILWKRIVEAVKAKVNKTGGAFSSQAPPSGSSGFDNIVGNNNNNNSAAIQPFEIPKNQDPFAAQEHNAFDAFANSGPYVQPQMAAPAAAQQQVTPQVASQYPQYNAV